MKKGETYIGQVEYADFPNKAVVSVMAEGTEDNGEKVIVKNSIPGQKVRFLVNKKRHGKCEGRLLEVLEHAPSETAETCAHFGKCGGCVYQSMAYEEQLAMKKAQVEKILSEVIQSDYTFEGILGSPKYEAYRNKMEFSFGDEEKDGDLALGLHKRNSTYDIVSVKGCKIVDADYTTILTTVLDYCKEKNLPYYHKVRHTGYLRHLLVRKAVKTGQILIDIVTTTQQSFDMTELGQLLQGLSLSGTIVGFLHTVNDSVADVVKNEGTTVIFGRDYIEEELLGLTFKITAFSFFQTNSLGAEVLYEKAREYVGTTKDQVVFDLYSGTGTIAQMLAPVAKKVIGVEIVAEAVEAAKMNAGLNGLDNCEFIAADVLKALDDIPDRPDFIMLDPPRDGVHPKALEKIIDYGVDRMVYISCKPTSLARDLVVLQERGYHVEKVCLVDMFPGTVHVETVVQLSKGDINGHVSSEKKAVKSEASEIISGYRKGNKAPETTNVKIDFSLENLDLSELRGKASYEQIKDYVREHTGFRVSTLYISQVKRKCGLEVGESYNKPKSEDARQPQCTPEKEEAIMQALRHYGVI